MTGFYLTAFLHETSLACSGVIIDLFIIMGADLIEHLVIEMLQHCRKQILKLKSSDQILLFVKQEMVHRCFSKTTFSKLFDAEKIRDYLFYDEIRESN